MTSCRDCKNCVHYSLCNYEEICHYDIDNIKNAKDCSFFKARSQFVELPCKVGDTVYSIYKGDIEAHVVNRLEFCTVGNNSECQDYFGTAEGIDDCDENFSFINFTKATFGKTVFLTRKEAEQALRSVVINEPTFKNHCEISEQD